MNDFDFWLDSAGLEAEAAALDSWGRALKSINSGLVPIVMSGQAGATIYSMAAVTSSDIHTGLIRWLAHMQNVFASVSREVRDVAAAGRTMDMKAAADMDRRDPTVFNGAGGGKVRGTAPVIAPPSDRFDLGSNDMPAPHWLEANDAQYYFDAGPGAFDSAGTFTEPIFDNVLMDPVGDIKDVLGEMGIQRPRDDLFRGFGGDWYALREYAFILKRMALFLNNVHSHVAQINAGILTYWQGYSANSARSYLDTMLAVIQQAENGCRTASSEITQFCDAVKSSADLIGGEIEDLGIAIYLAVLAKAANKKIGNPVSWVLGGGAIAQGYLLWRGILDDIEELKTAHDFLSTASKLGTQLSDFTVSLFIPEMVETS